MRLCPLWFRGKWWRLSFVPPAVFCLLPKPQLLSRLLKPRRSSNRLKLSHQRLHPDLRLSVLQKRGRQ